MSAMRDLMLRDGYEAISVRDITDRANIGRSTFYEHFANKADVLRESLLFVLTPLADTLAPKASSSRLALVLQHFWDARDVSTIVLTGTTRALTAQILAGLIEERLAGRRDRRFPPRTPLPLVARGLAELQLGVIGSWLTAGDTCPAEAIAQTLHAATNAAACAMSALRSVDSR
ncbi:MAG: helix-turn-helix domain-containing protein [Candidatus Elarobacter sp.]